MALQNAPQVAVEYARDQRRESAAAVAAVGRLWRRVGDDFDSGFRAVAPQMLTVMGTAQVRMTERANAYLPDVLSATGQGRQNRPEWQVSRTALLGVAGDGRPTESLAYGAVTTAKTAIGEGATAAQARARGGQFLSLAVGTMLADTARSAETLNTASRPLGGYVRMLTPPSCGRCVILAGKRFKTNQGFERHPGCDCVHIPASENIAGDLTTSPADYLDSLSEGDLAKALGSRANAAAYAEYGADSIQLVNAYRKSGGIRTAQIPTQFVGKDGRLLTQRLTVKATLEGTTVRGYAAQQMRQVRALTTVKDGRYRRVTAPRLMPESILAISKNKAHATRLLRDHGWI